MEPQWIQVKNDWPQLVFFIWHANYYQAPVMTTEEKKNQHKAMNSKLQETKGKEKIPIVDKLNGQQERERGGRRRRKEHKRNPNKGLEY